MGLIEAALALVGLVALMGGIARWHMQREPAQVPEDDLAAPYREGLHAAIRMQGVAQDLKQQLYAEADKHVRDGHEQP
jgi:hypothetical protein